MTDQEKQKAEKLEDQIETKNDQADLQDSATKKETAEKVEEATEKVEEETAEKVEEAAEKVEEETTEQVESEDQEEEPQPETPPTEEKPAEETSKEEPVVEEPVVEQPVAEEAVVEEPAKEEETPKEEEPEAEKEEGKETVEEEPVKEEEPVAEKEEEKETVEEEPVKEEEPVAEKDEEAKEESNEDSLPPLGQDYSNSSKAELVPALRLLLDRRTIQEIRKEVEAIKTAFYKRHRQEIEEKRKKFLESGGAAEAFQLPPDPLEEVYKELYESYRIRRTEYFKVLEEEKGKNLIIKKEIITKIENLVNSQESLNKTFNEFRDLQRQWRDSGPVPQSALRQLWESYHYHVEKFYDFIKINKELRDLDLKKNMEKKLGLCEKAEALLLEPSIINAFKELQELHAQWRETGPVPLEKKEELWERFKEATTKINKSHQDHFQQLKGEQKTNLEAKARLCEQVEEILAMEITSPNKWNELSRKVIELQKLWRTIGFAPKKDNNKVYERFRTACDGFFNSKREFFNKHRDVQNTNLQLKNELCIQAESLMNSDEWKQASEDLINIQKEWKKIGPVPRKHSDALWKRFRTACDTFFQRKNEHIQGKGSEQMENLKKKKEIIEEIKAFALGEDHNKDLNKLQKFQKDFISIGHVPFNQKDSLMKEFRDALNQHFDKLDIDESKRELLKFRQKIDNLAQSPNYRNRIETEREKLVTKLKQLESDVVLWENNIGFFSKSKKSDSLRLEVDKKIATARERISAMQDKLRIIDNYDY